MKFHKTYLIPSDTREIDGAMLVVPNEAGLAITVLDDSTHCTVVLNADSVKEFIKLLKSFTFDGSTGEEEIELS